MKSKKPSYRKLQAELVAEQKKNEDMERSRQQAFRDIGSLGKELAEVKSNLRVSHQQLDEMAYDKARCQGRYEGVIATLRIIHHQELPPPCNA